MFAATPWSRALMAGAAALRLGLVTASGLLLGLPSSRAYFRLAALERAVLAAQARLAGQGLGIAVSGPYRDDEAVPQR